MLQLTQAQRLSLDDSLAALLPDYPNVEAVAHVTVRQLLDHTSGLGDVFTEQYVASPSRYCSASSYLSLFARDTVRAAPAGTWRYSNAGYIVLGLIVERVSGQPFGTYVRDHVFRPAGMHQTGGYSDRETLANRAVGYTTRRGFGPSMSGEATRSNAAILPSCGSPAGGEYSTVGDLLRFHTALREHALLNREYTRLLLTGAVTQDENAPEQKSTLGLEELTVNGVRTVGHGGNFPGVSSVFDMYPELGYTVVVLSNMDNGIQPVNFRLRWILRGRVDKLPPFVHLTASALRSFTGSYNPVRNAQAADEAEQPTRVTSDAAGLIFDRGGRGAKRRFLPIGETEFADRDLPPLRLTFAVDASGTVAGFTLTGTGPPVSAKRIR